MNEFNLAFGTRLKKLRERFDLTQEKLGKASGLTSAWISHFECGRRSPNLKHFKGICDGFIRLGFSCRPVSIAYKLLDLKEVSHAGRTN